MTPSDAPPIPAAIRPTWRWMTQRFSRIIAFGFGAGLLRPAPGTWGTLAAWWIWAAFEMRDWPAWLVGACLLGAFALGCWACENSGRALGVADHGGMVWDEMVAFWLVLWLVPAGLLSQALAFLLFRCFDILKPPPIRHFDRRLKGGFGVMFDDLLAAFYTVLAFALLLRFGWIG